MLVRNFLMVGAGGAVGSMARYGVSYLMGRTVGPEQGYFSTFAINIIGSLIIGFLFGLSPRWQWLPAGGYLLLASGFCGGFTTFSSFALENVNLMAKGQSFTAFLYMILSIIMGLILCRLGIWLAQQ